MKKDLALEKEILQSEQNLLLNQLARLMPTVTVISVDNIIQQVNDIVIKSFQDCCIFFF